MTTLILEIHSPSPEDDNHEDESFQIERGKKRVDICRLCLELVELESISSVKFSKRRNNFEFLETELEFQLPQEACASCRQKLNDILLFVKKCKESWYIYNQMQKNCTQISEENFEVNGENGVLSELGGENVKTTPNDEIAVIANNAVEIGMENAEMFKKRKVKKHESEICPACGLKITSSLHEHYKTSSKCTPKNYKCPKCTASFTSRYKLNMHHQTKHEKSTLMCHICSKFMNNPASLQRHIKGHNSRSRYMCEICGQSFSRLENLATHRKAHKRQTKLRGKYRENSHNPRYCCKYCSKKFTFYNTFYKHLKTHREKDPEDKVVLQDGDLSCPICKKEFQHIRPLKNHILCHEQQRIYMCVKCQDFYDNARLYKEHMVIHDDDKKFTCPECSKRLQTHSSLMNHLASHQDPQISCTLCEKKFRLRGHLTRHVAVVHNINKGEPFSCKYCSKVFSSKGNLTIHERIHTGEKPYVCHVCAKGFVASNGRKLHVRKVHGEEEVEKIQMFVQ